MAEMRINGQLLQVIKDGSRVEVSGEGLEQLHAKLQSIASEHAEVSDIKNGRFSFHAEELAMDAAASGVPMATFELVGKIMKASRVKGVAG